VGAVELRAWSNAILDYVSGMRETSLELDAHHCRLGHWLDQAGSDALRQEFDDQGLPALHNEIHRLGAELVAFRRAGQTKAVQARIPGFLALRDQLFGQLISVQ